MIQLGAWLVGDPPGCRSHLPLLLQRMADWEKICGKGLSEVSVGESRKLEGYRTKIMINGGFCVVLVQC